jgi:hypothetical protein
MKNNDMYNKLRRLQCICGTLRRVFRSSYTKTLWELHESMAVPALLCGRKELGTAEVKVWRSVEGYVLSGHKANE